MKLYVPIVLFFLLFTPKLVANTIRYVDGGILHMVDNKATYTDPKGATTFCSIVFKTREITCGTNSGKEAIMFPQVNGRLQAGVRKMLRDAAP